MTDVKKTESKKTTVKKIDKVERMRISIFRSNNFIYAQAIDDSKGKTLVTASSKELKEKKNKTDSAYLTGELLAEKLKGLAINKISFDRNGYRYHGRVKALADGARAKGLVF